MRLFLFCFYITNSRICWQVKYYTAAAAAAAATAKSLQLCPTLCNPIDSSPLQFVKSKAINSFSDSSMIV